MVKGADARGKRRSTVQRAVQVMRLLGRESRPFGVTEVAEALDLPKASVYRLLRDLAEVQCVCSDERGGYQLGAGLIELGEMARRQIDLPAFARPVLQDLAHRLQETVNLGILHGDAVLVADSVKDAEGPRLTVDLGPVSEVHCSALGKALLAGLPEDRREELLGRIQLHARTERTITSREQLRREVDEVRRTGVAYDREECEPGLFCIAVSIGGVGGSDPAAISVSGPMSRLGDERQARIIQHLRSAAERLQPVAPPGCGIDETGK